MVTQIHSSHTPGQADGPAAPGLKLLRLFFTALALIYVVVTPPFQAPDEPFHFFKAYQLSTGGIRAQAANGSLGAMLPPAIAELANTRFPPQPDPKTTMRFSPTAIMDAWRDSADLSGSVFVPFPNIAPYAPSMYVAQATGILIGRQLGLPPIGLFYAGRLTNALAAIFLLFLAVFIIPFGRAALLAVAFMPTVLVQFGSLSADATIIALGFLAVALAMRGAAALPVRRGETWLMTAALMLLALAKGVYWPIAAAGLPSRGGRMGQRQWLLLAGMVLGIACFLGWVAFGRGAESQFSIVSRRTLERTLTALPADQLAIILSAPARFARILASSFIERLPVYGVQVIGRLGWNVVLLPLPLYGLGVLLLLLGMVAPWGPVQRPQGWQRLWWVAIAAGLTILIETALYLTGTPLGADYIQGTQGRYFLPFLPLLLLALAYPIRAAGPAGRLVRGCFPAVAVLLNLATLLVAIDAFWISGFLRSHDF